MPVETARHTSSTPNPAADTIPIPVMTGARADTFYFLFRAFGVDKISQGSHGAEGGPAFLNVLDHDAVVFFQ